MNGGNKMMIGELSKITGLSEHTLRFYEKKELIYVNRSKNGRRDYSANDIEWVKFITRLKDTGMLLRDIKRYASLRYRGDSTLKDRLELLKQHRRYIMDEIQKQNTHLHNLDEKY